MIFLCVRSHRRTLGFVLGGLSVLVPLTGFRLPRIRVTSSYGDLLGDEIDLETTARVGKEDFGTGKFSPLHGKDASKS